MTLTTMRRSLARGALRWLFLLVLYLNAASAALHAFLSQWGAQIGETWGAALAFELPRPFAYRVLTPALVDGIVAAVPKDVQSAVMDYRDFLGHPVVARVAEHYAWSAPVDFSFVALNAVLFCAFLATAFVWRAIARAAAAPASVATEAVTDLLPVAALVLLPVTFVRGGYLYDPPDLLLGSVCFLLALRERWLAHYGALAVALLNKESAVLVVGWLGAWAWAGPERWSWARMGKHVAAHVVIGGVAIVALYTAFADNGGGMVQHRFHENLGFWSSLVWLATTQDTHAAGVPLPAALNLVHVALLAGLVFATARRADARALRYALAGGVLAVLPLYVPFGFRDEVRVFGPTVIPPLLGLGALLLSREREVAGEGPPRQDDRGAD